ncbi:MAG: Wzz/FepE/Etk N-terminal domain-containing protein [Saprospiraceae bacterium]
MEHTRENLTSSGTKTDLVDVLRTLFKWKKLIVASCIAAGVGSAIIVLLLPVYYKATTTFYAISPDQSTPELIFGEGLNAPQLYGNENDIDRILTISQSDELIDFLVDSFNLYEHYDIDPNSLRGLFYVRRQFNGLYEVTKDKRDAIQLDMEDRDPELAAKIATAARFRINELGQALIKKTQQRSITTYLQTIASKEEQLKTLSDTLERIRRDYGIFNTEAQSESLTSLASSTETQLSSHIAKLEAYKAMGNRFRDSVAIFEVRVAGLQEELNLVNNRLAKFNEGLSSMYLYTRQYQEANTSLSYDKERLKQYQAAYSADIPALIPIEEAGVPLVKSRPLRTLLVLAAVFVTFLFTVIGVLLYEAYQDVDWKAVYQGK